MTFARKFTEWKERRAAESEANRQVLCTPSRSLHRGTYAGTTAGSASTKKKRPSDNSREALIHKGRLAALGCMACLRIRGPHEPGPVELHHLRTGGWGKGDYLTLIPLCVDHHRGPCGVHGLGTKGFAAHYGFDQQDLLDDALGLLKATTIGEKA
jgi:hypothetical protein